MHYSLPQPGKGMLIARQKSFSPHNGKRARRNRSEGNPFTSPEAHIFLGSGFQGPSFSDARPQQSPTVAPPAHPHPTQAASQPGPSRGGCLPPRGSRGGQALSAPHRGYFPHFPCRHRRPAKGGSSLAVGPSSGAGGATRPRALAPASLVRSGSTQARPGKRPSRSQAPRRTAEQQERQAADPRGAPAALPTLTMSTGSRHLERCPAPTAPASSSTASSRRRTASGRRRQLPERGAAAMAPHGQRRRAGPAPSAPLCSPRRDAAVTGRQGGRGGSSRWSPGPGLSPPAGASHRPGCAPSAAAQPLVGCCAGRPAAPAASRRGHDGRSAPAPAALARPSGEHPRPCRCRWAVSPSPRQRPLEAAPPWRRSRWGKSGNAARWQLFSPPSPRSRWSGVASQLSAGRSGVRSRPQQAPRRGPGVRSRHVGPWRCVSLPPVPGQTLVYLVAGGLWRAESRFHNAEGSSDAGCTAGR